MIRAFFTPPQKIATWATTERPSSWTLLYPKAHSWYNPGCLSEPSSSCCKARERVSTFLSKLQVIFVFRDSAVGNKAVFKVLSSLGFAPWGYQIAWKLLSVLEKPVALVCFWCFLLDDWIFQLFLLNTNVLINIYLPWFLTEATLYMFMFVLDNGTLVPLVFFLFSLVGFYMLAH